MSFRDIVGQKGAIKILTGSIKRGKVASSYLFAGEKGIGKRLAAVNFAMAVNCQNPVSGPDFEDACGKCPSCLKIKKGTHPDFTIIEPEEGVIKVLEIRDIEEALAFKPYEGRFKVVIVDDAEAMNLSSANAFLKTLEEPSANSLIILVTSSPDSLPGTIRSRCLRINFKPLSPEECLMLIPAGDKDTAQIVRLSMGRPGLALRENLLKERDGFLISLKEAFSGEGKHPWKDKEDIERWLDMLLALMRDMAVLKITKNKKRLINMDIADEIISLSRNSTLDTITDRYGKLRKLRASLGFNINKAVAWNYIGSLLEAL